MKRVLVLMVMVVIVAAAACGKSNDELPGFLDAPPGSDATGNGSTDATPAGSIEPGGACSCDADCASEGGNAGVCIYGVCMTRASARCSAAGSQTECPAGSRCWSLDGVDGSLCWPDCSAHACSATCDSDGSCAPDANSDCDPTCGTACSCTETSCGDGNRCVNGECVPDAGAGPGPGPGPTCDGLPARDCTGANCGELVAFDPRTNTAWDDYPINGETAADQYRSFLRRDLMMLVGYASSKTACKSAAWTFGNGGPLGLGDMSEATGAIPGTRENDPGHPAGTHVNGNDIDLAYYQVGTPNNRLREICDHEVNGNDQYHCVGEPTLLDPWRTAMFLGTVFESSRTRVIGVDGKVGPILLSALDTLCTDGWLSAASCGDVALAYETTDGGNGWYYFHHHHAHISLKRVTLAPEHDLACFDGECLSSTMKSIPKRDGVHRLGRPRR